MRSRLRIILLLLGVLTVAGATGCGDVERFPSTSLTLKPDPITDAVFSFDESDGAAVLTWTVPRTHGGTTGLRRYDLRFHYTDDFDWLQAERVVTPPVPGAAGQVQSYRFTYPRRGRVLCAAIRAIDDSGNQSEPGNVAAFLVPGISVSGVSLGYLSGEPGDVAVTLSTAEFSQTVVPDAEGKWAFDDLPESVVSLRIASAGATPVIFPVEIGMTLTEAVDLDIKLIPYAQSEVYPSFSLLALFKQAVGLRGGEILRTWPSRPIDVFIPEYVSSGGVDYRGVAVAAASRWMELTDVDLFRFVESPPTSGVNMEFLSSAEMGGHIGLTIHSNTPDGAPLRSDISIVNTFENASALNQVMMHELGHTIRLYHLPAGYLMYGGQPLPSDPTTDEIWFVRMLNAIADGSDLSIYREVGR